MCIRDSFHIARCHRKTVRAEGGYIHRSQTLAVCLPCTLALVGSGSAAPQKALGKFAHTLYLLVYFCAPAERRYCLLYTSQDEKIATLQEAMELCRQMPGCTVHLELKSTMNNLSLIHI